MNGQRNDYELLREFVGEGAQAAFAELARRHLNLVYATAWRKLQDDGAAQEVAQNVFAALARKAWQFAPDDSLPAWLHKTALLESQAWLRGELRRRRREQTAAELGTTMNTPEDEPALRALVPLLDEALLSLRERERAALLLRFYENRSLREVGHGLGIAEDATRKRVAGALDKLTRFFQRRGYKTASVAAAMAALQHTARSAPAPLSEVVLSAAARMAPAALPVLAAPLARLASLTKLQTAALCLAVALAPLVWQRQEQRRARERMVAVQNQLEAAQTEHSELQVQIDTAEAESARLKASLADLPAQEVRRAAAADKLAAWKNHLRAALLADDYRWPGDSPFVRIPKSVLKHLGDVGYPVKPPGILSQAARELLGLTPDERQNVETALQAHFSAIDKLIDDRIYETNALSPFNARFGIPSAATAMKIWAVPPLGDEAADETAQLQSTLQSSLGDERWQWVKDQLVNSGTDTLRRILNLDAARNPQEIAVWVMEQNGNPIVGYGWQGDNSAFSTDGTALQAFVPGTQPDGKDPAEALGYRNLPTPLTSRMLDWLHQQAWEHYPE